MTFLLLPYRRWYLLTAAHRRESCEIFKRASEAMLWFDYLATRIYNGRKSSRHVDSSNREMIQVDTPLSTIAFAI